MQGKGARGPKCSFALQLSPLQKKPVTGKLLKQTHSANHIVHNDVNIADLQQQISEIVCTQVLKTTKEECYITACSLTLQHQPTPFKNKRRKKNNSLKNRGQKKERETNETFHHNLSSHQLTDSQVSLLSRGLKFFPTPATNKTKIKQELLRDYEPHPFHVKSTWISQVQHSVALESYLENVKTQLAEIKIIKPKINLSRNEVKALNEL